MPLGDCFCMYSKSSSKSPRFYEHLCENNNKKIIAVSHLKTDYKNMLRYLMESCVLFDYTVIYYFKGITSYLIVKKYLETDFFKNLFSNYLHLPRINFKFI